MSFSLLNIIYGHSLKMCVLCFIYFLYCTWLRAFQYTKCGRANEPTDRRTYINRLGMTNVDKGHQVSNKPTHNSVIPQLFEQWLLRDSWLATHTTNR